MKCILCLTVAYKRTSASNKTLILNRESFQLAHSDWSTYIRHYQTDPQSKHQNSKSLVHVLTDRYRMYSIYNLYKTVEVLVFVIFYYCIFLVVLYLFSPNRHFIAKPAIKGLTFRISDFIFSLLSVLRWGWRGNYSSDNECLLTALYKETEDERPIGRIFSYPGNFKLQGSICTMKVVHFFLGFLVNLWPNLFNSRLGHRLEICRYETRCEILQTSAWIVVVVQTLYIILLLSYKILHQFQVDRVYIGQYTVCYSYCSLIFAI